MALLLGIAIVVAYSAKQLLRGFFRVLVILICALIAMNAVAAETKIVPVDKFGNKRYDKPSMVIKGNKVIQVDKFGNKRYDKPQLVIQKPKK